MTHVKSYLSKGEKLLFWLTGLIVLLLAIYIVTLNFAVSEAFARDDIEREAKILRQDLQKSEAFFIENISIFYGQYSGSFSEADISEHEFVSRRDNFAISGQ